MLRFALSQPHAFAQLSVVHASMARCKFAHASSESVFLHYFFRNFKSYTQRHKLPTQLLHCTNTWQCKNSEDTFNSCKCLCKYDSFFGLVVDTYIADLKDFGNWVRSLCCSVIYRTVANERSNVLPAAVSERTALTSADLGSG